jgi:F0F1-type ATP synthase membrane subunit c/vacuolar-type H+-ATPase subunit K
MLTILDLSAATAGIGLGNTVALVVQAMTRRPQVAFVGPECF